MVRILLTLAAAVFTSNLFAEEIYLYTSYKQDDASPNYLMKCQDSQCKVESPKAGRSLTLSDTQRDEILEAFQAELNRFNIMQSSQSGDRSIKLKFRYQTDKDRLQLSRRMGHEQLAEVSAKMTAIIKTYLELDLLTLQPPEPKGSDSIEIRKDPRG